MNKKEILQIFDKYEAKSSHPQLPVIWNNAIGHHVFSETGKKYIDFTSGIFTANSGHSTISKYLKSQINSNLLFSYTYPTEIKAKFIRKLMKSVPKYLEKVTLASTGGEATEIAVKLMRLASIRRKPDSRKVMVSFNGAMHGKSFLAEKLKGNQGWAKSHDIDFWTLPFPSKKSVFMNDIKDMLIPNEPEDIAGFIFEPYQGWSGKFMPKQYVQDIFKFTKKYNIPVCFDEIQGGFWRTGKLFSYEHYNVEPDLVCLGKGLGGGVPISAVLGKAELLDGADDLTSTFSGNPLCCAAALGNLENLDKINKLDLEYASTGLKDWLKYLKRKYPVIKYARSKGLLGAIIFKDTKTATKLCKLAEKKGLLLVYTTRNSVKIGPPLTICEGNKEWWFRLGCQQRLIPTDLYKGLEILENCVKELK